MRGRGRRMTGRRGVDVSAGVDEGEAWPGGKGKGGGEGEEREEWRRAGEVEKEGGERK